MAITKTLGGDRLGSGKKQRVHMHGYERSTHDLGYIWRSTMASGTLVPFMKQLALPGDTFDIDLNCEVLTHPTVGPLFGSFKAQLDVFMVPIRLYIGALHNDKLGIGLQMQNVRLPQLEMTAPLIDLTLNPDTQQINPSSIFSYLGIKGLGRAGTEEDSKRNFNGIPYLAYWDIYKNYYANKAEETGAFIHNPIPTLVKSVSQIYRQRDTLVIPQAPSNSIVDMLRSDVLVIEFTLPTPPTITGIILNTSLGEMTPDQIWQGGEIIGNKFNIYDPIIPLRDFTIQSWRYLSPTDVQDKEPNVQTFPLANIDQMRENILVYTNNTSAFPINRTSLSPYGLPMTETGGIYSQMVSQEGLALKTYQSDLFNNWLDTEWIDGDNGINAITAIDTSDGSFTIDTLNLSQKVYEMMNRVAVSGGSYLDYLEAVYDHSQYRRCTSPMYMGGLSKEVVFQEVVSTAASLDETTGQPLGTLGGRGKMSSKHKGGKITVKVDEPSYIMGIVSLTPRIDYSQGNDWDNNLRTVDDFHKPGLDEIGFQDLITDQMAWWDSTLADDNVTYKSAGKQPAWVNYMTNVNKTYGNFAIRDNEMFMTLNRRYEMTETGEIADLTTYIDPAKFNHIFAQTSRDAMNFWTQIGVDITARRKMSAKLMPNL